MKLRLSHPKLVVAIGLFVLIILFSLYILRSKPVATTSTLPAEAQAAIDRGKAAINQAEATKEQDKRQALWTVAIGEFEVARKAAPLEPEPLYLLGLTEAEVP